MRCDCGCEFEPVIEYKHRLICGDCTDREVVARVMGGERAQAVVTSPPYGVGMDYEGKPEQSQTVDLVTQAFTVGCQYVVKNGFAFVNFGERYVWDVPMVQVYHGIFKALGWRWYDQRFWKRSQVGMAIWNTTQPRAMSQVEYLFTFQNGNAVYPVHDLSISKEQLWDDAGSSADMNHPAVMALGIAEKAVAIYSAPSDVIYEPFNGSGTTIIACENLKRRARACELSPAYVAVALERWATMTGKTPTLLDGAP